MSSCTNVTLDARASLGHGGRAWSKVTWNVRDALSGVSVVSIVNDKADVESTIIYLTSGLSYGTYIVSLSLMNHLLATSTVTKQFTWGLDGDVYPSVVIAGNGVVQQPSSTRLQLQASVTLPRVSCAANLLNQSTLALTDVSFAWTIVDTASPSSPLPSLVSQSADPLVFSLVSYSLSAKHVYAVRFTVLGKHRESPALVSSETSVLVKISSGSLSARITGIGSNAMLAQTTLVRGDSSIDEDTSGTAHLQFGWSCRISSVPSNGFLTLFGSVCDATVLSTSNQSTTAINPLQLLTGYEYEITLTVTRPSDGTRSDTRVYVSRSPLLSDTSTILPKIDLLTLPTFINSALTTEFPATLEVPVAISLRQTLQAEWTGRVGSTLLSLPTSLSTTTKNLTAVIRSALNRQAATLTTPSVTVSFVFIAPPGTFAIGTNPTFTLAIRNVVSGVTIAFSTITVPVLSPPMNGILSVSPRNGSAFETVFSLVTMRWAVVDPSSLPLTYAFAYQMSTLSPTLLLQFDRGREHCKYLRSLSERIHWCIGVFQYQVHAYFGAVEEGWKHFQYVGQDYRTLQDCSGHGVCQYSLGSQLRLSQQCTVADVECYRRCECTVGYAGEDCSLSPAEASERDTTRGVLCTMLGEVITRSDAGENPDTFRSMASTLNSLFRPSEVSTVQTLTLFANTTSQLLTLLIRNPALFQVMTATAVSQGLNGTTSTTDSVPAVFVSLLSTFAGASFLEQAKLLPSNENEALAKQKLAVIGKVVSTATETFTTQLLSAMIPDQAPLRLGSDALQMILVRNDLSSLAPAEYMALTLTNGAAQTETDRPSMHLSYPAAVALDNGEGQLLASLGYWTQSPFVLDHDMKSGLLRSQIVVSTSLGDEPGPTHNATEHFLQIPFMTSQSLQTMETFLQSDAANVTLPVCSLVAGDGQEELTCRGCQLSTYNNQSATFECATIDSLIAFTQFGTAISSRRSLQTVGYDDEGSSTTSISQFGALLERVEASVVSTLSFNPFHVDLEQSKGIVAFVGLLCLLLVGGGAFFYSWDAFDHAKMIYNNRNEELMTNDTALNRRMSTTMRPSMIDAECLIAADSFSPMKLPSSLRPASERWLGTTPQTPLAPSSFSSFTPAFISHVLDAAIPLAQIDPTARTWLQRQWDALLNNHEYFDAFGSPSLHESRFLRFLRTMQSILVMFFADTLFFGIFFPDQGTCEALQTETDCLSPMNKVTGQRLCVWDSTNYRYGRAQSVDIQCSLRSPPNDVIFTVLLSTMTLLVVLPIMLVLETIRIKICRRQPDLTVLQRWLASVMSCFPSMLGPSVAVGKPLVADKASTSQSKRQLQALSMTFSVPPIQSNGKEENKESVGEEKAMKSSPTTRGTTARPMGDRAIDLLASPSSSEDAFDADGSVSGSDSMTTDRIEAYFDELLARAAYADHASLQTEAAELLRQVREFFALATNNQPLPKDSTRKQHYMLTRMAAKTMAIEHTLGLRTDGSDTSMAQVQSWLRHVGGQVNLCHNSSATNAASSASSLPQTLLEHRLHEARERTHHVEALVTKASRAGLLEPDVALLQCFVLEQFSTFKQFILRYHFFDFPYAMTSTVHPVLWMMGWCIYVGFQCFAIYWIFAWCVYSGNSAFRGWGINGVLSVVQDVVLVQGLQVYLLFVAGIESLVPQLRAIYCRLYEVALRVDALQESGLLDEVRIVQFVSPACRASRRQRLSRLNAATILRCMDDIDVDYCRRQGRTPFSAVLMVVVALPGLINIATHSFADFTLRLVLPSMVSFAFVGFYFAYSTSLIFPARAMWMENTIIPMDGVDITIHSNRNGGASGGCADNDDDKRLRHSATSLACQQSSHTTRWQVMNNPFARDALAVPEEICLTEDANIYHQMVSFSPLKSVMSMRNATTSPSPNRHSLALSRMSLSNARSQQMLQLSLGQAPVVYRSHLMNINAHHMHSYERRVMAFDLKDAYRHIDGDVRTLEATSWAEKLHRLRTNDHHRSSKRSWRDSWQRHLGLRSRYRLVHRVPATTPGNGDTVTINSSPLATQLPLFSSSNPVLLVSNEEKLLRWDGVASRWHALYGELPSMKELMPVGTMSRRCGDDDATVPLVHEGDLGIASGASSVSWWNRPLPAEDAHGLLTCSSHSLNEETAPLPPGDAAHSRRPSKQGSSSDREQESSRRRHRRRLLRGSRHEYDSATIATSLAAASCRSSGSDLRSYDAYEAKMTGNDNGSDDGEDVRYRTLVSAAVTLPALPPRRRRSSGGGGSEHVATASSSRRRTISSDVRSQSSTPSLSLILPSLNDSSYDTGSDVSSALSRVPSWSVPSMDSPAVGIASRRASDLLISDEPSVVEGASTVAPPQAPPLVSRSVSLEFHLDHVYEEDAEFEASSPHGRHQEERSPWSPSTPSLLRQKSSKLWEQSPDGRWRRIEPSTDSP
eukprot:gene2338-1709_t